MFRFKTTHLFLALGLITPIYAYAANFCIASGGGFGGGGTSYIAPVFTVPAAQQCTPFSGFTKTADTVILFSTGVACMAAGNKVLTFSIFNTDPAFYGAGNSVSDQIVLCRMGTAVCPVSGEDQGNFGGSANEEACSATLLKLPASHD